MYACPPLHVTQWGARVTAWTVRLVHVCVRCIHCTPAPGCHTLPERCMPCVCAIAIMQAPRAVHARSAVLRAHVCSPPYLGACAALLAAAARADHRTRAYAYTFPRRGSRCATTRRCTRRTSYACQSLPMHALAGAVCTAALALHWCPPPYAIYARRAVPLMRMLTPVCCMHGRAYRTLLPTARLTARQTRTPNAPNAHAPPLHMSHMCDACTAHGARSAARHVLRGCSCRTM